MEFQRDPLPATLFKFRSYGAEHYEGKDKDWVRQILRGRLRFSRQQYFNDPFEGQPYTIPAFEQPAEQRASILKYFKGALGEVRGLSSTKAARHAESMIRGKTLEELRQLAHTASSGFRSDEQVRIFCLSGPKAVVAPLTWSHYADCHRGVCIHFSTNQVPFKLAYRIVYSSSYPEVKFPRTEGNEWDALERGFLWKSDLWKYEDEYRLIRHGHKAGVMNRELANLMVPWDGDVGIVPPLAVAGITLGVSMSLENRKELTDWIAREAPHIEVWEASLHERRYEILSRLSIRAAT